MWPEGGDVLMTSGQELGLNTHSETLFTAQYPQAPYFWGIVLALTQREECQVLHHQHKLLQQLGIFGGIPSSAAVLSL